MKMSFDAPILVVDDVKAMTKIFKTLLKQIGFYNVDEAHSGGEALRKIEKSSEKASTTYQLIISDWHMEDITGLDLFNKLRTDPMLRSIPFVMATSDSQINNLMAADKLGVDQYLVKPFTSEVLRQKIECISNR